MIRFKDEATRTGFIIAGVLLALAVTVFLLG